MILCSPCRLSRLRKRGQVERSKDRVSDIGEAFMQMHS